MVIIVVQLMKIIKNISTLQNIKALIIILLIIFLSPLKLQANLVDSAYRIANKRHIKHVPAKPSNWFVHTGKYYNEAKNIYTGKSDSLVLMNRHVYNNIRADKKKAGKENSTKKTSFNCVAAQQIRRTAQSYSRTSVHNQNNPSSQKSPRSNFQSMSNNFSSKTQITSLYSKIE